MNGRGLWIVIGLIGLAALVLILNHDSGTVFGLRGDDFASLVFYGLWGTVIAAAIIPRSGGLGTAARNAAIWLLVILVLVAGYVYRFDLQDFGSRMTAGLIPGSPVSGQSADGRDQVILIRSPNGHFEAEGFVNGAPVRFLVDTGASVVVLTGRDAEAAGIDISALSYSAPVNTANGQTRAAPIRLGSVEIGAIGRDRVEAMVAQPGALDQSLLGMSFLGKLWSFEIRGDRLILTR